MKLISKRMLCVASDTCKRNHLNELSLKLFYCEIAAMGLLWDYVSLTRISRMYCARDNLTHKLNHFYYIFEGFFIWKKANIPHISEILKNIRSRLVGEHVALPFVTEMH